MRWMILSVMAALALIAATSSVRAEEVVIRAPFVTVQLGTGGPGGVIVTAPFVRVQVPPRGAAVMPAPPSQPKGGSKPEMLPPPLPSKGDNGEEKIPPGMLPPPVPVPPPDELGEKVVAQKPPPLERLPQPTPSDGAPGQNNLPPPATQILSHRDFAKSFQPLPGTHRVTLLHPDTGQPVTVQFTLPPDALRKTHVAGHEIEFKYKKQQVRIRFKHDGQVSVEYRD